jgi:hypothetical protein
MRVTAAGSLQGTPVMRWSNVYESALTGFIVFRLAGRVKRRRSAETQTAQRKAEAEERRYLRLEEDFHDVFFLGVGDGGGGFAERECARDERGRIHFGFAEEA